MLSPSREKVNKTDILPPIIRLVHEAPLHAGGEASTSATTKPRRCDLLKDPFMSFLKDLLCFVPLALEKKPHIYTLNYKNRDIAGIKITHKVQKQHFS